MVVVDGELHEQVMRLLPIMDGVALTHLAEHEVVQGAASGNRQWLGTEHRADAEAAGAEVATSHGHAPVDASDLMSAGAASPVAIARFVDALHEQRAVQPNVP